MELNSIDQERSMIMMGVNVNATNSIDQNYRLFDKIDAVSQRNVRVQEKKQHEYETNEPYKSCSKVWLVIHFHRFHSIIFFLSFSLNLMPKVKVV